MAEGKFKFSSEPPAPMTCAGCGRMSDGKTRFLDTTLSIDYYGAVIICEQCVREMAATVEFFSYRQVKQFIEKARRLEAENLELSTKNEALENVVFSYGLRSADSISVTSSSDVEVDSDADEGSLFS